MRLGDELAAFLAGPPSTDDARVTAWRFELADGHVVRLGMRDGRLGGPYEAPSLATRLGGSVELCWSDGHVTRATLHREDLGELPSLLSAWRAEAYRVPRVAPPAPPAVCPAVQTHDPHVAELASERPDRVIDLVLDVARALDDRGIPSADVSVAAGAGRRRVATSAGVDAAWQETTCTLDASAEELHGAAYARRRLPRDDEAGRLAADVAQTVRALRHVDAVPTAPRGILYTPAALDALLGRFLATNLAGRAILGGQSRFTPDDVAAGVVVMRADLALLVDTTLPFEVATAPCSVEGVPAGRVALIRDGRLVTPLLDRERAAQLDRPPTPAPRGHPSLLLETAGPALDLDGAVETLGEGVVVRAMIGLHTQNARRGEYAIVVPAAQVVRGGRLAGRAPVRVRGNLFAVLAAPATRLVRFPDSTTPGLLAFDGNGLLPA